MRWLVVLLWVVAFTGGLGWGILYRNSFAQEAAPLAGISVCQTVKVGQTLQLNCAGKDQFGNPVIFTSIWSCPASAGTVSATGLFSASSTPGNYQITCSGTNQAGETYTGRIWVTVVP